MHTTQRAYLVLIVQIRPATDEGGVEQFASQCVILLRQRRARAQRGRRTLLEKLDCRMRGWEVPKAMGHMIRWGAGYDRVVENNGFHICLEAKQLKKYVRRCSIRIFVSSLKMNDYHTSIRVGSLMTIASIESLTAHRLTNAPEKRRIHSSQSSLVER